MDTDLDSRLHRGQARRPISISLVATPEVDASALAGLHGVFNAFHHMVPDSGVTFSAQIVAPDALFADDPQTAGLLHNVMGFTLPVAQRLSQVKQTDVLIIPSLYLLQQRWPPDPYPQLTRWIIAMHARGSLLCSACTAAFLPAETGLLDGQEATQHWLRQHSTESSPVEKMTRQPGLIPRTFDRRFIRATGHTPIRYVQQLRISRAKQLLEQGSTPVDEISWQVGYEDAAFFRRLFRRLTGMTPRAYRNRFYMDRIND